MELLQDTILGHWTRENNSYSPPSNMNAVNMKKIVGHKLNHEQSYWIRA